MNAPDIFYIVVMPLGLISSLMDTACIIRTRSAKARSISGYGLALLLVLTATLRSSMSLHDFWFTLNGVLILTVNTFQWICIWKWRNQ